MATKKQPVIRAGAHGDLALDKTERNTYLKQVSRLRKLLKDDKVDLDHEAALTIVAQCSDMKDRNGTALGECEPGRNCPDLSLLKNSSDARVRQIYQTRAVRGGKAWQCVPRDLIMAEDIPRDGNQEYEFNDAVAQLATEVKNINNIQRWHSAIKGRYCKVIDQALVGGEGFELSDAGHREQANRNARDLCGRAAMCNWVPDQYSADKNVRTQWQEGKYDVDEDGKPIKLPEGHGYKHEDENPGRCLPTIDDLARTIQAEARTLEGLVPKEKEHKGTYTVTDRLTAAQDATVKAAERYQQEKHVWGLIGAGERRNPPKPLTQVQKAQPGLEELNTMWNVYSAAKRTETKVGDMFKLHNDDSVPHSYRHDMLRERLRKSRMWEDFDGRCVAAGEIPGATYEDCQTTSMNPDEKLNYEDGVCAVISGTTGDIKSGEKKTRLSDTDQCRVKEGEGSTWNRVHDPTNHRYEVESIRSTMPDTDMFQAIHAADHQINLPSNTDDTDLKDFVKRTNDLKTQLKDQFSKNTSNDQSIFAAGGTGTAAIIERLNNQVSDEPLTSGYLIGNINKVFKGRKTDLISKREENTANEKKLKRYDSNVNHTIRMEVVKKMQDFLDPILSNAEVYIQGDWSEDDRAMFASKADETRAGEHFRRVGEDLIYETDTDEFPVYQADNSIGNGTAKHQSSTRKYTVNRYNMTDDGVDMWLTDGHDSIREFAGWGNITNLTGFTKGGPGRSDKQNKFLIIATNKRNEGHYRTYIGEHTKRPGRNGSKRSGSKRSGRNGSKRSGSTGSNSSTAKAFAEATNGHPAFIQLRGQIESDVQEEQLNKIEELCPLVLAHFNLTLDTEGFATTIGHLVVSDILADFHRNGKTFTASTEDDIINHYVGMIEKRIYVTTRELSQSKRRIPETTRLFFVDKEGGGNAPIRLFVSSEARATWGSSTVSLSEKLLNTATQQIDRDTTEQIGGDGNSDGSDKEETKNSNSEEYYNSTAFETDTASHFGDDRSLQGLE